jgi:hypothetical protein
MTNDLAQQRREVRVRALAVATLELIPAQRSDVVLEYGHITRQNGNHSCQRLQVLLRAPLRGGELLDPLLRAPLGVGKLLDPLLRAPLGVGKADQSFLDGIRSRFARNRS